MLIEESLSEEERIFLKSRVLRILDESKKKIQASNNKENHDKDVALISIQEMKDIAALFEQGRYKELEARGRSLTVRFPGHSSGWHFLGMGLIKQDKKREGLEALLKAGEIEARDPRVLDNLGRVLFDLECLEESLLCHRRSYEIAPDRLATLYNLAVVELRNGNVKVTEQLIQRILACMPGQNNGFRILGNLSLAYFLHGDLKRAISLSCHAQQVFGAHPTVFSNLLLYLSHDESVSREELVRWHKGFSDLFEKSLLLKRRPHQNNRNPEKQLRLGFVSADLRNHAVMYFIEPLIKGLDKNEFELYGFFNYHADDKTREIQQYFKQFFFVMDMPDEVLVELIKEQEIDILIDLSGHTAYNRLVTFAYKPAPVQMSTIGYPETTGLAAMDYYVVDVLHAPVEQFDDQFCEALVRIPKLLSFSHPKEAPAIGALPALKNGFLTFGSFNRLSKINTRTLEYWCNVLKACPGSKMLIGAIHSAQQETDLTRKLKKFGIKKERIIFRRQSSMKTYLDYHNEVDIALDTFPYNGGTTTNHAYWMGVPVLTIEGGSLRGNAGALMARRYGLPQFAARDSIAFVETARYYNDHLSELAEIRRQLRPRLEQLVDENNDIAMFFGRACRQVWRRWCAGEKPAPLLIE